ncbi:C2H2 finger domain-containing protein [Rutstroemia sp. NJR-2017a BBW]|nr:C2H2 finger domain-containing protein [Rutstroemia sp. NJR-2017a BBW]
MTLPQHDEDLFYPTDEENDYTTDDEFNSIFDEGIDNTNDRNDTQILSDETDSDTEEEWLFDDEGQRPPEFYLSEAADLNVKRLRQRRYSPKTQERLDWVKDHWHQYCIYIGMNPIQCYHELTTPFYQLVYKLEVGKKIDDMIIRQGQDVSKLQQLYNCQVVKMVADEKGLNNAKRESATMYVEDLAEFARVLLATTQMTFEIGWLRIQLIFFCQIAGITGNRPEALVDLRFRHLNLTLIRDRNVDRPRLFIELTTEYTKGYLGMKGA